MSEQATLTGVSRSVCGKNVLDPGRRVQGEDRILAHLMLAVAIDALPGSIGCVAELAGTNADDVAILDMQLE